MIIQKLNNVLYHSVHTPLPLSAEGGGGGLSLLPIFKKEGSDLFEGGRGGVGVGRGQFLHNKIN